MLFSGRNSIMELIIMIPAILLALTVHEFAHAWAASKMGDHTARSAGRVSLNPFVHLDLMGTIVMILTGFIGWAKPVPVDYRNMKNGVKDLTIVAAAGPVANILAACFFIGVLFAINSGQQLINTILPESIQTPLVIFFIRSLVINVAFAILNLIPVPPLDGFNVIANYLPPNVALFFIRYRMSFMFVLILFIWKGPFATIIHSIIVFIFKTFLI